MKSYMKPYHETTDQKKLRRAWEDYMVKGILPQTIHPVVGESWEKSRSVHIDPLGSKIPLMEEDTFRYSLDKNRLLLQASEDILDNLKAVMENSSSLIELFDAQGTMLKIAGDPKVLIRAELINNIPRSLISEEASGTNAVSLALKFQQPNFMSGSEHYCQMFHDWNCYAVPIFNRSNESVIGVLDLTGPFSTFNNHTFGLIQTGAYAIEKVIHKYFLIKEYNLLDYYVKQLSYRSDVIIAINVDHVILNCQDNRSILDRLPDNRIGMPVADSNFAEVGRYLHINETQIGFQISLENDKAMNCNLKKVFHNEEFVGWILHINVRSQSLSTYLNNKPSVLTRLIGKSGSFVKAIELAKRVRNSNATILILGETGTGKEEIAKSIHLDSVRRDKPFISINCGAIPKDLIASELFGYEEGAFSGAKKGGAKGKFETANGGTIFLDEVGELPPDHQVYLLRVLQEKKLQRVGGSKDIPLDVRIMAATNADLAAAVKNKTFRMDLYYRLNVVTIKLPSLQERGAEDILALTEYFLNKYNQLENKNTKISDEVLKRLCKYSWPGNVRELENRIYKLVILSDGQEVHIDDFHYIFDSLGEEPAFEEQSYGDWSGIDRMEKEEITKSFVEYKGNISKAAKSLGISRSTFYRKLNKYRIQ